MIPDNLYGALYLSVLDMVLLIVFLTLIGWVLKLFPIINKFIRIFNRKEDKK
ncbi:hypothetical protein [Thermoanaerobacterium sp. RBIITD]|uniref:hypothetical protein n=1 Tax=Thermoanaerobacterium sp. RBIITD TaxID=1550240 RepID=UPI000BC0F2E3|nr:hypothetical protein [Thermoanaerobacterium sp. RBIITD]SNX54296.1 hypothetical protein SAMN05660242_1952 [Thermoanaerobacterium sp. RBIITD]